MVEKPADSESVRLAAEIRLDGMLRLSSSKVPTASQSLPHVAPHSDSDLARIMTTSGANAAPASSEDVGPEDRRRPTAILGRRTLQYIHGRMPYTELPSWMNTVPNSVGTKARGKLSADQWHIFCVVYLPIILIRAWYQDDSKKDILDNFMDLVTEVVVGSLLEMSQEAIAVYETVSLRYLQRAQELYPSMSITPNQHNSLHISLFLALYGPLHSIRTFFSERMNFLLQRHHTNTKFGELAGQVTACYII